MKKIWFLLLALSAGSIPLSLRAQTKLNLDLEARNGQTNQPLNWYPVGGKSYAVAADCAVRRSGQCALRIESTAEASDNSFGGSMLTLPADDQGKNITLTGYLKLENVQGSAGLLLRVDGEAGVLAFNNMAEQKLQGTRDWQQYRITLPLPEQARSIKVGGVLLGSGKVWVDDLALAIDGEDLMARSNQVYKADLDTASRSGLGPTLGPLSRQQVEHLAVLGRVWGFVKYHHPVVAAGNHNMDAELFRLLPKVLAARRAEERNQLLSTWVSGLGEVKAGGQNPTAGPAKLRLAPSTGWIDDKRLLGAALSARLQQLRTAQGYPGPHYYVAPTMGVRNPEFKHENAYSAGAYADAGLRLLALFRYWNIIEYYFPYKYAIGEDWTRVLPEFIPQFAGANDATQYQLAALRLIGRIHDTHANIWSNSPVLNAYKGAYHARVQVKFVDGQAVVTDYYHAEPGPKSGVQRGDVVLRVDGVSVARLVQQRRPLYPASNEPTRLRDLARDLLRGPTNRVVLRLRRDGREFTQEVERYPTRQPTANPDSARIRGWEPYRVLPGNIGYFSLNKLYDKTLPDMMKALQHTRGLVIDMRNYPSDFLLFQIAQHLLSKPVEFVKFSRMVPGQPGAFEWSAPLQVRPGKTPVYAGKVVILVNEQTQSSAEYHAMALRTVPGAVVVGSTTAGADGNVSRFSLPGNIPTMISGIGVYYPDGRETQRLGIVPDVRVEPTIKGIREGRDEVLEKAVQLIEAAEVAKAGRK